MFQCKRCGQCCNKFAISVGYSDVNRWFKEERYDIINELVWYGNKELGSGLFFATTLITVNGKAKCPFYNNNNCTIHNTKPMVCIDMPIKESKFSFCPEYENIDSYSKVINDNEYIEYTKLLEHKEEISKLIEFSRIKVIESNFK